MTSLTTWKGCARSEWIDVNGHVNDAHYGTIIYQAHAELTSHLGAGGTYDYSTGLGKMVVEQHTQYQRELRESDVILVRSWVLGADAKRLHVAHQLVREEDNVVAATVEQMDLSVDLSTRKVTPFPDALCERMLDAVTGTIPDDLSARGLARFAIRS